MKIKKELIILPVILVILVLYLIFNFNQNRDINYDLPELVKVKEGEITKIQFTNPTESVTLVLDTKEDVWKTEPEGYPVSQDTIDKMLKQLAGVKIGELISDKQVYDKYELDATNKVTVNAYRKDELVRSLDIGKASDVSDHSFIKLSSQPEVYSIEENMKVTFDTTVSVLRDKVVMKVNKDSITKIVIEYEGETLSLDKVSLPSSGEDAAEGSQWRINGGELVANESEVNNILTTINNLTCDGYITDAAKEDFSDPIVKVTITGDKVYTLEAQAVGLENLHPAISSENGYQFKLIGWKINNLTKKMEDFLKD